MTSTETFILVDRCGGFVNAYSDFTDGAPFFFIWLNEKYKNTDMSRQIQRFYWLEGLGENLIGSN